MGSVMRIFNFLQILLFLSVFNFINANLSCIINRRLMSDSEGFHRTIQTKLKIESFHTNNEDLRPHVLLIENITSSFYIDIYQTTSLFKFDTQKIHTPFLFNLESSEPESVSQQIYVFNTSFHDKNDLTSLFTLPFHVRYHAPQFDESHIVTLFPSPLVFLETYQDAVNASVIFPCYEDHQQNCTYIPIRCDQIDELNFAIEVPVGKDSHYWIVLTVTCFVITTSLLYFSRTLFKN